MVELDQQNHAQSGFYRHLVGKTQWNHKAGKLFSSNSLPFSYCQNVYSFWDQRETEMGFNISNNENGVASARHNEVVIGTNGKATDDLPEIKTGANTKPGLSYIALISMAIQSSSEKRMLLSEIYQWITNNFPYYKREDRSWRNSIRHNLSLNECFVKSGRSGNCKGNYWTIHVATMEDFDQGDYRRRHARSRVRKCEQEVDKLNAILCSNEPLGSEVRPDSSPVLSTRCMGYVPMTSSLMSTSELISIFGVDTILTKEEQLRFRHSATDQYSNLSNRSTVPTSSVKTTVPTSSAKTTVPTSSAMTISYPASSGYCSLLWSHDYTYPTLLPISDTGNIIL